MEHFNHINSLNLVEKRIYQSGPTKSHKTLVINGCRYQYHKKLPRIRTYLLHNGKRIEQNENNTSDRSDDTNVITTPSYTIDSYDRIGSYHCEVFIEEVNVTFLSRQLFVGVKDLPGKQLMMYSIRKFHSLYSFLKF